MTVLASGALLASKVWASQGGGFQNLYLCSAPSGVRNGVWQGTVLHPANYLFLARTLLHFSSSLLVLCGVTSYSQRNKDDFFFYQIHISNLNFLQTVNRIMKKWERMLATSTHWGVWSSKALTAWLRWSRDTKVLDVQTQANYNSKYQTWKL